MATVTMTMAELLNKLKVAKNTIDTEYKSYLDPESDKAKNSKVLLNLYHPDRNVTIKGIPIEEESKSIEFIYNNIVNSVDTYMKLLMVKNVINSKFKIIVPDILRDKNTLMPISEILVLKTPSVKNYYLNLVRKLKDDRKYVENYLAEHESTVLSNDRVDRYVIAKLNSLNKEKDYDEMSTNYAAFAKEFKDANKLEILDPLGIDIVSLESNIINFYNTIDYKLLEFNTRLKLKINFDASVSSTDLFEVLNKEEFIYD